MPSRITLSTPHPPSYRFNMFPGRPRREIVEPTSPAVPRHRLRSPWDAERVHTALRESGEFGLASVLITEESEERIVYVNRSFVVLIEDVAEAAESDEQEGVGATTTP